MTEQDPESIQDLLAATITVPDHVVTRSFEGELVVLNLQSGEYHGLNAVAAKMFDGFREAASPSDVVDPLVSEFDQSREVIERDVATLVKALSERGLVELGHTGG